MVSAALATAGLDADKLMSLAESDACRNEIDANTEEAISRGVFGVPAYLIGDQLFWGQDRLDFVERALAK